MSEIFQQPSRVSQEFIDGLALLDVATLYEAAGQRGMVDPAIRPAWDDAHLCGPAVTVLCPPGDNLMLHQAVTLAQPGDVLVASIDNHILAGAWGEILTVAAQARGISGLVIDGAVRDSVALANRNFPVFSRGLAIGGCTKTKIGAINEPLDFGGLRVQPGDIVVGDRDGVVIVDRDLVGGVYEAALQRRRRERVLIEQLQKGKTTLELLGLPKVVEKDRQRER